MERKVTGMTRKVDDLGRIVLPAEIRRGFGIAEGDRLEISVSNEQIILHKVEDRCVFCNTENDLWDYHGKMVCLDCRRSITKSA